MDVVICTCIYNRVDTLKDYIKSLKATATKDYELIFVLNYDDLFPHDVALRKFKEVMEGEKDYKLLVVPNEGLRNYNYGLDQGREWDKPVLLCNDDTIFGKNWCENLLNENITRATLDVGGEEIEIDPESVGVVAPTYRNSGCQKHQQFDPIEHGYSLHWFVVGHAQVITKAALKKGFSFKEKYCSKYGPFDVYQAQTMQILELNQLVARETYFDFPEDKRGAFHCGQADKFRARSHTEWHEMIKKLDGYKNAHVAKHRYDKWLFTSREEENNVIGNYLRQIGQKK